MKTRLKLLSVSGYFETVSEQYGADTTLTVELEKCALVKHNATLFFNGKAFSLGANSAFFIPSESLQDINVCLLQDKTQDGKVVREWRVEKLILTPMKLDESVVQELEAEREFLRKMREEFAEIKQKIGTMEKAQEERAAALVSRTVEENERQNTKTSMLAQEIVKQAKQIEETKKDIAALKNEPLI